MSGGPEKEAIDALRKVNAELLRTIAERRRAEEALRESGERFRDVIEQAGDGLEVVDAEGRFVDANPAALRQLGYSRDELLQLTVFDIDPLVDRERFARLTRTLSASSPLRMDSVHRRKDGSTFAVEVTISPVQFSGRACYLTIARDMTERGQAADLSRSRQWLALHVEQTPLAVIEFDPAGRVRGWNPAAVRMFGFSSEEAIGQPWTLIVPEMAQNKVGTVWEQLVSQRGGSRSLNVNRTKTGQIIHCEWFNTPLVDSGGATIGVAALGMDVTEHVQAEQALRASEARFKDLAELLPQTVFEANVEAVLTYANQHAFNRFGYSREDLDRGLPVLQMIAPEDRERASAGVRALLIGGVSKQDSVYRALRKDGGSFPVEIYSSPIVNDGVVRGLRGIIVDITERRRAEEERERLRAQLDQAQKMESVGRLAGGVAHDFNNMLSVILGHTELAIGQVDPALPLHANLLEIRQAAQRSADLTRQLLAFARRQPVTPRVLDLNDTVGGMLKMLRRLIGEDIALTWTPEFDLPPVRIDPSQVDQILTNLCVNARHAIQGGGRVSIATKTAVIDDAYCAGHPDSTPGRYVVLEVADDGYGMEREVVDRIFEPFYTTKGVGEGTGLGLSTVYGIVRQNGGFVEVRSAPGEGAVFSVLLPEHEGAAAPQPRDGSAGASHEGQETVLLVEDEPSILRLTTRMLEGLGYRVLAAGRPTEAIRLAKEHSGDIHLLLADVVMPEMNGLDLAKRLLSLYPHLKRVFVSGYPVDVIAQHGVLDEGTYFVQKPFTTESLSTTDVQRLGTFDGTKTNERVWC